MTTLGCGPSVAEVRTAFYPPREAGCGLEFVKPDMGQVSAGGDWELLGHVIIGAQAKAEPFSEAYMALVRPRACAMGGDAVGILMSTTSNAALVASSSTDYVVLRKRHPSPAAAPATGI